MIPGVRTTGPTRYALTSAVLVFAIGAVLLVLHFADLLGQYRTYDYALALWHQKWNAPASLPVHGLKETGLSRTADAGNTTSVAGDKVIVMAKVADENTDWVRDYLPECVLAIFSPSLFFHTEPSPTSHRHLSCHQHLPWLGFWLPPV